MKASIKIEGDKATITVTPESCTERDLLRLAIMVGAEVKIDSEAAIPSPKPLAYAPNWTTQVPEPYRFREQHAPVTPHDPNRVWCGGYVDFGKLAQ